MVRVQLTILDCCNFILKEEFRLTVDFTLYLHNMTFKRKFHYRKDEFKMQMQLTEGEFTSKAYIHFHNNSISHVL